MIEVRLKISWILASKLVQMDREMILCFSAQRSGSPLRSSIHFFLVIFFVFSSHFRRSFLFLSLSFAFVLFSVCSLLITITIDSDLQATDFPCQPGAEYKSSAIDIFPFEIKLKNRLFGCPLQTP